MNNNFFALFDLPISFDTDKTLLKEKFLALQKQYHPDNTAGDDRQSALINHAFNMLYRDDNRAIHLLQLSGHDINLTNSINDLDFLDEMMDIRIRLDECDDKADLLILLDEVDTFIKRTAQSFCQSYKAQDWDNAKAFAQKLQFLGKLQDDVQDKLMHQANNDSDDDLYV
ncbi:MAG: Fe-S protein assembly co-chaperone HscB [Moraxella sp.]|nr:Fe-S protein assembly co-chaperone HscB [Moraxella sp.]